VITARCGTGLSELERCSMPPARCCRRAAALRHAATVGGCVAAGLAGPRRASAGGVRDYVLGAKLLTGRGEVLSFGGTVMRTSPATTSRAWRPARSACSA